MTSKLRALVGLFRLYILFVLVHSNILLEQCSFHLLEFDQNILVVNSISRIFANTRMTWIFTAMALSLFNTQDSMVIPCSVKQNGAYRSPCLSSLEDAFCVLQSSTSLIFISKKKSIRT